MPYFRRVYFNPRPREEGDAFITDVEYINNISIHALVKRATTYRPSSKSAQFISIHALVKRATNNGVIIYNNYLHFNPRPREEGDSSRILQMDNIRHFNPRPREEGDIFLVTFLGIVCYFNPRPREEGDIALISVSLS